MPISPLSVRPRLRGLPALVVAAGLTVATAAPATTAAASAAPPADLLQRQFASAAAEFGVPQAVLLALSYQETRWEDHHGEPSTTGNYGVLGLTQVDPAAVAGDGSAERDGRGEGPGEGRPVRPVATTAVGGTVRCADSAALLTLDASAELINRAAAELRTDSAQNIRGGAALLARYRRTAGSWYQAVARFGAAGSQSSGPGTGDRAAGRLLAERVFTTVRGGVSRTTLDGHRITLPADPALASAERAAEGPVAAPSAPVGSPVAVPSAGPAPVPSAVVSPECPSDLGCDVHPAAYALTDPRDPTSFGNYNPADRPADGQAIRFIVIHDTEGSYDGSIAAFQDPEQQACAHYLVRSADGHVTQLVRTQDIAWHAGNKSVNMHSIGIEHEGYALPKDRPTWYSEQLYQSSAELVRYLAARFGVPLDRQHVIGHDDVPGPTQASQSGMHWDPGTFWDWGHYLDLLNAPIGPGDAGDPRAGDVVTIAPAFDASNEPPVGSVTARPENFVYLRTRPADDAPLIDGGGTAASDWSDKAVTGTGYVVAGQQGEWTAIWYDGQQAWFHNAGGRSARLERRAVAANVAAAGAAFTHLGQLAQLAGVAGPAGAGARTVLTPRAGLATIPVYGRAYPESAAYARYPAITAPEVVALRATIPAGQAYLAADDVPERADFFYDRNIDGDAPDDRTLVVGQDTYYPIRYNHRLAYLRASDVQPAG
ncbi:N-acetylmuramoyl-L-alanine amidase [Kitasatospora nipponensis]|uniref:N-acetylmuramoyl-L-alanine amidase n=1 Tax=Kitasatospora nipponensis TaxID=258049 RepID=A0ABN1T9B2_9ACTN